MIDIIMEELEGFNSMEHMDWHDYCDHHYNNCYYGQGRTSLCLSLTRFFSYVLMEERG